MNTLQLVRRARPFIWSVALLALIAMVMWWASAGRSPTDDGGSQRSVAADMVRPGVDLYPTGGRVEAPALAGTTLEGTAFDLSNLRGRIVVLNVWGSWCAPCRAETPDLVRVANATASQGVNFVGINTRDNRAAARAFVRTFKVPYPSVEDAEGQLLLAFRGTIPTSVVPTTLVIDRQGRFAARIIGPVSHNTLKGILDDEIAADRGDR
jgi:thiol-disulfide isomerase/thioredoxin